MAYRDNPIQDVKTDAPRIWRPWMTRLGIVLVCLASPIFFWFSWVFLSEQHFHPFWYAAWFVISIVQAVIWIAIGAAYYSDGSNKSGKIAVQIAWAWIYCPYWLVRRIYKWIVSGD